MVFHHPGQILYSENNAACLAVTDAVASAEEFCTQGQIKDMDEGGRYDHLPELKAGLNFRAASGFPRIYRFLGWTCQFLYKPEKTNSSR
jgi:hypothetical protein